MDASNSSPLVSVVTPAYNEERFLPANLQSAKTQTYENVEHIVIDDGSTDGTTDILREYEDEYQLRWVSQENKGLAAAVNRGFDLAEGEFVVWLNADDVLFSDHSLTHLVEIFQRNKEVDLLCSPFVKLDADSRIQDIKVPYRRFSRDRLLRRCYGAFIFMRSEIPDNHSLDSSYNHTPDYEYYLRLAEQGYEFGYVDKILFAHRRHPNTKTESSSSEMEEESRRCRRAYGASMSQQYKAFRMVDLVVLRLLKLWGIYLISVNLRNNEPLAFEHPQESLACHIRRILRRNISI